VHSRGVRPLVLQKLPGLVGHSQWLSLIIIVIIIAIITGIPISMIDCL
jgi:hypothetical protein